MVKTVSNEFEIRRIRPDEYEELGQITVDIYKGLPGMPRVDEQQDYYAMLYDVESRAARPTLEIFVAVTSGNELLGGVTFVGDMKYYGAGGTASAAVKSSGIRLLVVKPEARRSGVGMALTRACIQRARERGNFRVILHTTKSMAPAWQMYQDMGFIRSPDLDFSQGKLQVFGFHLPLDGVFPTA